MKTPTENEDLYRFLKQPQPSTNMSKYWITYSSHHKHPHHTELGGKWLVPVDYLNVDKIWEKIKKAQDDKILGHVSKVATALNARRYNNSYVVCVYTYDSSDTDDMLRVREGLRSIGFTAPLNYKRDIETINNIYGTDDEFLLTV